MTSLDVTGLDLGGLTVLPGQTWGGVRLVPLVRPEPIVDLRLDARLQSPGIDLVAVKPRTTYVAYIPHAFVASWTRDGTPAAAYGTQMQPADTPATPTCLPLRFHRRIARRVDKNRLRFFPQHLAMDGYLALHFGGPTIVWEEWSQRAIRNGLSPRIEDVYVGAEITGLEDALRVFEIHPGQCGVLVYVADALAGAFVVPHPEDYRALHPTLIRDMYGDLIYHYATFSLPVQEFRAQLVDTRVHSLADLHAEAVRVRAEWAEFHNTVMAQGLLDTSYTVRRVYRMGRFALSRFLPPFDRGRENHIGEVITDDDGRVAYLKTFRLSDAQVRRGYLLTQLAAHWWHLPETASALGVTTAQLGERLRAAGFGALLRQDVLDRYRAATR